MLKCKSVEGRMYIKIVKWHVLQTENQPTTTSFPGSLISPSPGASSLAPGGGKMRDTGNEVEPTTERSPELVWKSRKVQSILKISVIFYG